MTNLYYCRINKGYTQEKLAKLAGVSLSAIRNFEQKRRLIENATLPVLISIAEVLSVPIYKLIDDTYIANRLYKVERNNGGLFI
jgi:transcriptional regulator with XRE-family HTH domain